MTQLLLDIDVSRGRRAGLEDALRRAVVEGRLAAGDRVPSTRTLAAELGWARATVVGAYEQLVAEGYLLARHGSATRVAALPKQAVDVARVTADAEWDDARPAPDFLPGEPDRSSFPRAQWLAATRRVLAGGGDDLFGYPDARGLGELRAALSGYLARSRAVAAAPDRVVVFGGYASALAVLAATVRRLGVGAVAVEDPCLPLHRRIVHDAGLAVVPVPVDADGIDVDALDACGARLVLTTPAHQYPLGVPLAAGRRAMLVEWARRRDGWVVEDDYDGEFRFDRQPLGSLQGLDPDRVVYAGTASKSLAAGLRIAWLVLPPGLLEPVVGARRWRVEVSNLDQAVLADLVDRNLLDRHLRAMRTAYRRRRDALVRTLAERAPWLRVTGISAGLHATAHLGDGAPSERAVLDAGRRHGLALVGLGSHWARGTGAEGIVVGYSRSASHGYAAALDRLGAALDAAGSGA